MKTKKNREKKKMSSGLTMVKVRGVWMNANCVKHKSHGPKHAGTCPYCQVCEHGQTECSHCEQCTSDHSWMLEPISKAEINKMLDYFATCGVNAYLNERLPNVTRYYGRGVPLVPLAIKILRELVREHIAAKTR